MAWSAADWIHLANILEASIGYLLTILYLIVAYFVLNTSVLKGLQSDAVIWSKPLALLAAFGAFTLGTVAFIRALGFDSVSELVAEGLPDTVNGVKLYDLRWVGSMLWVIVMAYIIALYNAFRDFTMKVYWAPLAVWAVLGYVIMHSTTWWQIVLLTGLGVMVLLSSMLATIGNSYVAFYLLDISKWIMYTFFFGSMVTSWVILLLSSPYAISNWGVMGQVWPEYVFFVTQMLAAIITPSVAIYSFMYREPLSRDLSDFFGRNPTPTQFALSYLLPEGQIATKEQLEATFQRTTGSDASRSLSGSKFQKTPAAKAWHMSREN